MKRRQISFVVVLITLFAFAAPFGRAQDATAQRVSPSRNWGLSFSIYSDYREGADSLPVKVIGIRGGKLSPNEKFKIEVTRLLNSSGKSVTGAEFTWYLFDDTDLDKVVDSARTPEIKISLLPNRDLGAPTLILYLEDIPYLKEKNPHGIFRLEVALTKAIYDDGSTWEAAGLPAKFDYSKMRSQ